MKIGVFDSGAGGRSVANAIKKAVPEHEVVYRQDKKNLPYGNKTEDQLYELVVPILQGLEAEGCKVIVVACNTVTTTIIQKLRRVISVPLIGIEPMIKPAVQLSKTKVITVCATPTTLKSARYLELKNKYASNTRVIEPDCSTWATMIEDDRIDQEHLNEIIEDSLSKKSDVIVMGCTHYHWIEEKLEKFTRGKAIILQPEQAVITRLVRVLSQLD